jgi:subtilisin family serine protease
MKRYGWISVLALVAAMSVPASADQRFIVRDTLGINALQATCLVLSCQVQLQLGDPAGQLFLVTTSDQVGSVPFLTAIQNQLGIVDAEVDQQLSLINPSPLQTIPESLMDEAPLSYYGAPVWHGYVFQPASKIVRVLEAQNTFNVAGAGVVAIIDTGVDTEHQALSAALVPGYDFTRNISGADEKGDVNQSSAAVLDGGPAEATYENQYSPAVVNQSSAAVLDGSQYAAFGHGTMTAGIVHLVAPTAKIMPLKAFSSDGTGYLSNVIRATYYAVQNGGKVISMSFSFSPYSKEMEKAINYAHHKGLICVASAGNDGQDVQVYPAALRNVMGVASTTDYDTRSSFSNYGDWIWVAAPGEAIVTTYPYGTFSAGWGTSFSAPFVSGTAALLVSVSTNVKQQSAAQAIAHAQWISSDLGNGRLDTYDAVEAWISAQPTLR